MEIPDEVADKLGSDYELTSKRKGFRRYRTPKLEELIDNLSKMEKQRDSLVDDSARRVFADFDARYVCLFNSLTSFRKDKWSQIINHMAIFDCLMSLARYCKESSVNMCLPEFDFELDEPFLEIRRGYHPSLASGTGVLSSVASEYIPNDTVLGGEESTPQVLLLTGANMVSF